MESYDRLLGKLEAHHKDTRERLVTIEKKVDFLMWKVAGIAATISLLCTLVFR